VYNSRDFNKIECTYVYQISLKSSKKSLPVKGG
jgi:hypothetical protein